MKVRAKHNVRDINGWHLTGQVFDTDEDLGDAVEVLDAPKAAPAVKQEAPKEEPEKVPEPVAEKEQPKARSASRRRVSK